MLDPQRTAVQPARRWPHRWPAVVALAFGLLTAGLLLAHPVPVAAANIGVAPPLIEQCNDSGAAAGQEIRCTIEIVNYLTVTVSTAPSPASTVTITRCSGPAGAPLCAAPVVTTLLVPATVARQCNAALYGGGSVIRCSVTIANHWAADPAPTPATIFECVGSPITGPGAPGSCTPLASANTAPSTPIATVGQCNGSGYGGGTPVGGFICTVATSTTTAALPVHVDQCNGSGYGGGGIVICSTTVTNDVVAAGSVAVVGGGGGATPPASSPEFRQTHPNGGEVAPTTVVAPVVVATPAPVTVVPFVAVPTVVTVSPIVTVPTAIPVALPAPVAPVLVPRPAATGSGGLTAPAHHELPMWPLGLAALTVLAVGAARYRVLAR